MRRFAPLLDYFKKAGPFFQDTLRLIGLLPEFGRQGKLLKLCRSLLFAGNVKDASPGFPLSLLAQRLSLVLLPT